MRVSFNESQQNEEAFFFPETFMARACFPNVYQFPIREKQCFQGQFLFQDANYTLPTRQGILTKIRACERLQKFCEHEQASTHVIFASNSSNGKVLRALSNWMGLFYTPKKCSNFAKRFAGSIPPDQEPISPRPLVE